eukprot:CAMPEP_0194288958 /NCGR_PEP_ID=MMETSP0169-20130528/38013_1 /TAXON_ID=218684 /ORGANISM="Corethron pennatum, Strain L29A3" /LENGTH=204 /DNA_ID=CAMNT_0039036095 /DNA_START=110 /DNA_END=721 /DNA_ORIENTATION=-
MCRKIISSGQSDCSIGFATLHVSASAEVCRDRNGRRKGRRRVPDQVLEGLLCRLEPPGAPPGAAWDVACDVLQNSSDEADMRAHDEALHRAAERAMSNPVRPVSVKDTAAAAVDRAATARDAAHQADVLLRAFVGRVCRNSVQLVAALPPANVRTLALHANETRREILEEIRRRKTTKKPSVDVEKDLSALFVGLVMKKWTSSD